MHVEKLPELFSLLNYKNEQLSLAALMMTKMISTKDATVFISCSHSLLCVQNCTTTLNEWSQLPLSSSE